MKTDGSFSTTHDYQLIGIGGRANYFVYEIFKQEKLKNVYAIDYDDRQFAKMPGITTLKMGNVNWDVPLSEQSSLEIKYDRNDFRVFVSSSVMLLNEAFYSKKKNLILITYLGDSFSRATTPMIIKRASKFGKYIHVLALPPHSLHTNKIKEKETLDCIHKIVTRAGWIHFCNFKHAEKNLNHLTVREHLEVLDKVIIKWLKDELPITRI